MDETALLTLVLGGARSGKSEVGERLAAACTDAGAPGPVTYVATGRPPADGDPDPEWAARVEAHRRRRPASWSTVEVAAGEDLGAALGSVDGVALVDSLTTWVAGLAQFGAGGEGAALVEGLLHALVARRRSGRPAVLVSDEVGLGVVPSTAVGGAFRDALGNLNRRVADRCDQVLLVVAGRVLELGDGR